MAEYWRRGCCFPAYLQLDHLRWPVWLRCVPAWRAWPALSACLLVCFCPRLRGAVRWSGVRAEVISTREPYVFRAWFVGCSSGDVQGAWKRKAGWLLVAGQLACGPPRRNTRARKPNKGTRRAQDKPQQIQCQSSTHPGKHARVRQQGPLSPSVQFPASRPGLPHFTLCAPSAASAFTLFLSRCRFPERCHSFHSLSPVLTRVSIQSINK